MSLGVFLSIVALHFVAAMSPGPSFVVSVRTAAAEGFRPALGLAVAYGLGALIWALAALFGLALLFNVLPATFSAFKIAGGVFLIVVAYKTIRHASDALPPVSALAAPRSLISALRLGLVTQLANPKPAVFFGAVFAGLVPADTPVPVLAALLAVITLNETLWYVFVARVFSFAPARAGYARMKRWVDRTLGGLIGLFGLKIALT
ncbi:Threonine efflux protein [Aquimixticola soesokkakensis]|uniref:Threonine efflux protein n=1 Tax=Aquimixticola soesokkakensis TaxID=1519096 RepID=A0A1Y5TMB5_9RHOB|nr:LysE family transporter [Aquimixticola soesokkakensis]SLN65573.1 Threonine efflux protein [Aquimixticola soesokkakensis]